MQFVFEGYRANSKADVPKRLKFILNSNDRMHFHQKATVVSMLRNMAENKLSGRKMIHFNKDRPCGVTLTVYTPTARKSDPDNLQPTLKALMDGFTSAHLWTDDNHEVVKYTKYQYGGLSGTRMYRLEIEVEGL